MVEVVKRSFKLMGTVIDVSITAPNAEILMEEVEHKLHYYVNLFSANDDDSMLMSINHAAGIKSVTVDKELFNLIKLGLEHSLEADSYLNIAIGPLVQLWRIGFNDVKIPSKTEVLEKLSLINPRDVIINEEEHSVYLSKVGMKLDLGCIAKGYIADQIMYYLKSERITSALINLGGNVLVHGPAINREDKKWRVGIVDPKDKSKHKLILKISNESVVTSGIYERKYDSYHHILSLDTGYPIENDIASISVVSKKSVDCEIWTTRLFGFMADEVLKLAAQIKHIEVIVVKRDGTVLSSMKGK